MVNKPSIHVLMVEDEPDLLELYTIALAPLKLKVHGCSDVKQVRDFIKNYTVGLCLTDMRLPDGSGLDVIQLMRQQNPPVSTVVISAFGQSENVVEALRSGAFDYLIKPVSHDRLAALVKEFFLSHSPVNDNKLPRTLLGGSPVILHVRQMIEKLSKGLAPVFITGESGTGKERAARMMHDLSPRKGKPFIAVNCGAIPEQLVESEFFGYKKGAFTGADKDRDGFFHAANGGTLLLDEVAELPVSMQVKLLRVLQERRVRRVGGVEEEHVDVRILSASHQNLAQLVKDGKFRHDLYYRLNVIELRLPALRERREDLPDTINAMLQVLAEREGLDVPPALPESFMKALYHHPLKGNLRELENILERGMMLGFSLQLLQTFQEEESSQENKKGLSVISPMSLVGTMIDQPRREILPVETALSILPELPFDLTFFLEGIERIAILRALRVSEGNRTNAARMLGLSLRQLRYRIAQLKLEHNHEQS
jgi:two-component system response regulator PilR (NtrC family)